MSVRIFGPEEIRAAVTLDDVVEPVRRALEALARGEAETHGYVLRPAEDGDTHVKSASVRGAGVFTVKVASWFAGRARLTGSGASGFIAVLDARTGDLQALLVDAHWLSDLRTAAAGALAARLFAPAHIRTLGVLGTGVQARLQAAAVARERPVAAVRLWGRDPGKAAQLASDVRALVPGVDVQVSPSVRALVEAADVVVTATASRTALIEGAWLRPGQLVTALGADDDTKRELAPSVFARADRIVVDDPIQALRSGDAGDAISQGAMTAADVTGTLGEALLGRLPPSDGSLTVVKLVGLGVQDLAAAEVALARLGART